MNFKELKKNNFILDIVRTAKNKYLVYYKPKNAYHNDMHTLVFETLK